MGKGDKRTRRGKIFAGSFGKTRPKHKKKVVAAGEEPKATKKGK
ncbi:MAG: 30S ribosomal protein THX [Blastocatellia bacterium]